MQIFFFLTPKTPFHAQNSSSVAYVAFALSQLWNVKDLFLVCFSTLMKPRELTSLTSLMIQKVFLLAGHLLRRERKEVCL